MIEVQPPVLEPRERVVGHRDQRVDVHVGVVLDAHDVEVVVARIGRRAHDGAVRPRLDHVAHRGVRRIAPGPCAGRDIVVHRVGRGHAPSVRQVLSRGPSRYDGATSGRTHQAPADVALLSALPGWTIHAPGHPDELERMLAAALRGDDRVYIRMSEEANREPVHGDGLQVLRHGSDAAAVVVAVGPTLDQTLAATLGLDVTVAYLATVRPFDADGVRALVSGTDVVLVEPYLAGTSAGEVAAALADRPHRLLALGVANAELRRYGTGREHRAAHGLDAVGIRRSLQEFLA